MEKITLELSWDETILLIGSLSTLSKIDGGCKEFDLLKKKISQQMIKSAKLLV